MAWSERASPLATIGQDYYDPDLLAYDGAFPLSEAYHVELDVDAGAGPRRFTLYLIPPERGEAHAPFTRQAVCRRAESGNECPAVAGGTGALFRRRSAAHRRRDADAVVGARASPARPPAHRSSSRSRRGHGIARAGCRCRAWPRRWARPTPRAGPNSGLHRQRIPKKTPRTVGGWMRGVTTSLQPN